MPYAVHLAQTRPSEPWFTPSAALLEVTRLGDLEQPVTLRVVDPANGLEPVEVAYRRLGTANVVVGGEVRAGVRWEIRQPDAPLVEEIVDASGETLVSRTSLGAGLGILEIARTTKAAAAKAAAVINAAVSRAYSIFLFSASTNVNLGVFLLFNIVLTYDFNFPAFTSNFLAKDSRRS